MKFHISTNDAIKAIEDNMRDHTQELRDAIEVWSEKLQVALKEYAQAVNREGLKASTSKLYHLMMINRPVDHHENYMKYLVGLKKAELAGQLTVEVDEDDVDHIYRDNWSWREQSKTANSVYKK